MVRNPKPTSALSGRGGQHENMWLWTKQEDIALDRAVAEHGHRWDDVAKCMPPKRKKSSIRNRWFRLLRSASLGREACRQCGLRGKGHTCLLQLRVELEMSGVFYPGVPALESLEAQAEARAQAEAEARARAQAEAEAQTPVKIAGPHASPRSPAYSPLCLSPFLGPFVCEPLANLYNMETLTRHGPLCDSGRDDWLWLEHCVNAS